MEQEAPKEREGIHRGKPGAGEERSNQGKILGEQIKSWPKQMLKLLSSLILSSSSLVPSGPKELMLV